MQAHEEEPLLRRNTQIVVNSLDSAQRAALVRALHRWYRKEARDLPWRRTRDPYRVWLAEVILQQTRVQQGLPYYERFVEAFPRLEDLARASEEEVLRLWEGLGYYTRARNLHRCARLVLDRYGGRFPSTAAELEGLPGVGPYTAAAIAGIAFGERAAVVDGNVARVLARLHDIPSSIDDPGVRRVLWDLAEQLLPNRDPGLHNQAMMELGACVCTPRSPCCPACPVRNYCRARISDTVNLRPVRRPRKRTPHHEVVVAVIRKAGRYLVGKRPASGLLGGLWEFPGGKIRPGETHEQALRREVREETGLEVRPDGLITSVDHAYSHFRVRLHVYRCRWVRGEPQSRFHTELKWLTRSQFDRYPFPQANRKFLHLIGPQPS